MVWTGVALLVASVIFLVYKHPLKTWETGLRFTRPMFSWWRRLQQKGTLPSDDAQEDAGPGSVRRSADDDNDTRQTIGETKYTAAFSSEREQPPSDVSISDTVSSEETTPKAKPTEDLSAVISSIPQFNLDGQSPASDGPASACNASSSRPDREMGEQKMMPPPSKPSPLIQPPAITEDRPASSAQGKSTLAPPRNGVKFNMAPPPRPSGGGSLRPPPSAASSLRVPMNRSLAVEVRAAKPGGSRVSRTVPLEPGHSPLDWAALTSNPANSQRLRGDDVPIDKFIRVKPAMLKAHNGRKGMNAWTSYRGKVYNITPYIPFHPGGKGELLRCAGKDAGKLFNEIHPWVNWDGMLGECLVGILVSDNDAMSTLSPLEEMD